MSLAMATLDVRVGMGVDERLRAAARDVHSDLPCRTYDPDLWFSDSPADLELAKSLCAECPLVQSLNVLKLVDVYESFGVDQPLSERIEHERVVGIRAVRDADDASGGGGFSHESSPDRFALASAVSMS